MKFSAATIANAIAWMVVALLAVAAILVTNRLGFFGLLLLGALTWLVCTLASLDQRVPTWGVDVFKARMQHPRSAEDKAAAHAEHQAALSPFRFYGLCGAVLAAIGAAGFAWQTWLR